MPIRPPIRYLEAWRMLCDEGVWRPMRGPVVARRGNVESQNLAMLRMGRRWTRHPQVGSCRDTGGGGRVYVRKLVVRQRLRFFPRPCRLRS